MRVKYRNNLLLNSTRCEKGWEISAKQKIVCEVYTMNPTVRVTKTSLPCTVASRAVTVWRRRKDMQGIDNGMHVTGTIARVSFPSRLDLPCENTGVA